MNYIEYFAFSSLIMTMVGFGWKLVKDVNRIAKEGEEKRARIYTRVDEVKNGMDVNYIRKDICNLQHTYTNKKLDEIANKVDKLLEKNGVK